MARRLVLLPICVSLALLALLVGSARAGGEGEGGPKWKAELVGRIHELRTKAEELRLRGSLEDAKHLMHKAAALEQVLEIRRLSVEAEKRGHALREEGKEDQARAAMEESGRLWKKSEEKLRDVDAPRVVKGEDIERKIAALRNRLAEEEAAGKEEAAAETRQQIALLKKALATRGKPEGEAAKGKEPRDGAGPADRVDHMRLAAKHLREAGMADLAEKIEREATLLAGAMPPGPPPGMSPEEIDGLRREIADLRRQLDELRAALRAR